MLKPCDRLNEGSVEGLAMFLQTTKCPITKPLI